MVEAESLGKRDLLGRPDCGLGGVKFEIVLPFFGFVLLFSGY